MEENDSLCSRAIDEVYGKDCECKDCCLTCLKKCNKECILVKHYDECPERTTKQKQAFRAVFKQKKP